MSLLEDHADDTGKGVDSSLGGVNIPNGRSDGQNVDDRKVRDTHTYLSEYDDSSLLFDVRLFPYHVCFIILFCFVFSLFVYFLLRAYVG